MRTTIIIPGFALLAGAAFAQFTLERATTDAGGGSAIGTTLTLDATIGQPDATNELTSTSSELTGGFWAPEGLPDPCPADFNGDDLVDIIDFGVFGSAFGSMAGDANYDERADFNGDDLVDIIDFGVFGSAFGDGPEVCAP